MLNAWYTNIYTSGKNIPLSFCNMSYPVIHKICYQKVAGDLYAYHCHTFRFLLLNIFSFDLV